MQDLIIYSGLIFLVYAYYKYKKKIGPELIIAFLISLAWVSVSGLYDYRDANFVLFGINLFPLIAWTAGLVIVREVYERLPKKTRFKTTVLIYLISIIVLEYVGYNYMGIQLSSNYTGLFGFELMHMPFWGKLYYLTIGPVYLKVTDYLGVE